MSKTKFYWGDVIGVGSNYIDISKSDLVGDSYPEAGDHIFQLGNDNDVTRQNAQIISTMGDDSPSWKMYEKINTKNLTGKSTTAFTSKGHVLSGKTKFLSKGIEQTFDEVLGNIKPVLRIEVDKEVVLFKSDFNGTVTSYSNGIVNVRLMLGDMEVYPNLNPGITEDFVGIKSIIENIQVEGCSATLVNGVLTITNMTAPSATITLSAPFSIYSPSFKITAMKIEAGYVPVKGTDYFDGAAGQNGVNSYLWVRYSQNSDGTGMTTSPINAKYIGVATSLTNTPVTDYSLYKWSLFRGTDGIAGEEGADGRTSYLHIKYSNDGLNFTPAVGAGKIGEQVGAWIGTYVDFIEEDSEIFSNYTWNKVRGENGYTPIFGTDYFDGQDGQDGTSQYLWVRYSQFSDGTGMIDTPAEAKYIGIATTTNGSAPTNKALYNWTLVKGTDGVKGEIGADGKTSWLHVKYSDDGVNFTANNGEVVGAWIGTYVDFVEGDSLDFSRYTWNKVKGEDGTGIILQESQATEAILKSLPPEGNEEGHARIVEDTGHLWVWDGVKWSDAGEFKGQDGVNGVDGKTQYLHIKYSNDGLTFTGNNGEDLGDWIGTFVDFIQGETHTTFDDYNWHKIKGLDGYTPVHGTDYFDGNDGQDGLSSFLWVRYSQNSNGFGMTTSPINAKYIGIKTTTSSTPPSSYTLYDWTLIKGQDGVKGEIGADGRTSYLHIKYSDDGVTFTPAVGGGKIGETPGKYIGNYVDFTEEDSETFTDYTWNKIGGEDGRTPVLGTDYFDGVDGQDGVSSYLWIRYSQNSSGDGMVSSPVNAKYVGVATTTTPSAPTSYNLYNWTLIKGSDGIKGEVGADGKSSWLHIRYSDNGTTFTGRGGLDVGAWIGTLISFSSVASTTFSHYTWNRVKGDTGDTGEDGQDAVNIVLTRQGSFRTYYQRYDSNGDLLATPVLKSEVLAGYEYPVGSGNTYVKCQVFIFKGIHDVTASAIDKNADLKWYINGNLYTGPTPLNENILLLGTSYADGVDDFIEIDYNDINILNW